MGAIEQIEDGYLVKYFPIMCSLVIVPHDLESLLALRLSPRTKYLPSSTTFGPQLELSFRAGSR